MKRRKALIFYHWLLSNGFFQDQVYKVLNSLTFHPVVRKILDL